MHYSPVRHWYCYPFDLHVLGTPPAFVLSQDQTLKFYVDAIYTAPLKPSKFNSSVLYDFVLGSPHKPFLPEKSTRITLTRFILNCFSAHSLSSLCFRKTTPIPRAEPLPAL